MGRHRFLFFLAFMTSLLCNAQTGPLEQFKTDPQKEAIYIPYLAARHGGSESLLKWKQTNRLQYQKELWYYTESFTIVRDYASTGVKLDEAMIDISRFEHLRLAAADTTIVIPGYRDGLLLPAANKLRFKPEYVK